jgi:hypothetical protein
MKWITLLRSNRVIRKLESDIPKLSESFTNKRNLIGKPNRVIVQNREMKTPIGESHIASSYLVKLNTNSRGKLPYIGGNTGSGNERTNNRKDSDKEDPFVEGSSNAKRPGYKKGDVDSYEKLSPGKNRAPGNQNTAADNRVQAHHPIQNEWAERNVKGYDKNKVPSVLLESSSGKAHAKISAAQRARRRAEGCSDDINYEFNTGYKELIDAGVDPKVARKAMNDAYKYFYNLGAFK